MFLLFGVRVCCRAGAVVCFLVVLCGDVCLWCCFVVVDGVVDASSCDVLLCVLLLCYVLLLVLLLS